MTLTQFADVLGDVPEVVWGAYQQTMRRYHYRSSGREYLFEPGEVNADRIRRVSDRVQRETGLQPHISPIYLEAS